MSDLLHRRERRHQVRDGPARTPPAAGLEAAALGDRERRPPLPGLRRALLRVRPERAPHAGGRAAPRVDLAEPLGRRLARTRDGRQHRPSARLALESARLGEREREWQWERSGPVEPRAFRRGGPTAEAATRYARAEQSACRNH